MTVAVHSCLRCKAAAILPVEYSEGDPLDHIVHQPWCRSVAPSLPLPANRSALGAHRRPALGAQRRSAATAEATQ